MEPITDAFIRAMPKVELHLHIEGTLMPSALLTLAVRNRIELPWADEEAIRRAYQFSDLQSFLDVYYQGAGVLQTEQDFYDLAWAWCEQATADHTRHAEVFFDPQTHTERKIPLSTVIDGLTRAFADARQRFALTVGLIPCFLRHLSEEAALACFRELEPFADHFVGFGLDSSEKGNPPDKFVRLFTRVHDAGFAVVAHAGEEGPASYIRDALDLLGARRIDHGVRCTDDPQLVARLAREQIPLTVCPLSNVRLGVFPTLADHNLKTLLELGLCATVNSDDPAYFGGYLSDNFIATTDALDLSRAHLRKLGANAINASFCSAERKAQLHGELEHHFAPPV